MVQRGQGAELVANRWAFGAQVSLPDPCAQDDGPESGTGANTTSYGSRGTRGTGGLGSAAAAGLFFGALGVAGVCGLAALVFLVAKSRKGSDGDFGHAGRQRVDLSPLGDDGEEGGGQPTQVRRNPPFLFVWEARARFF